MTDTPNTDVLTDARYSFIEAAAKLGFETRVSDLTDAEIDTLIAATTQPAINAAVPAGEATVGLDAVLTAIRDRRDNGGGSASYQQACNHIIEAVSVLAAATKVASDTGAGAGEKFTAFELGRQDYQRGEPRGPDGGEGDDRVAGWDAAYRDSLAKAAGGLRRIHAGRYESEDGMWSIVQTDRSRWSVLYGIGPGLRSQAEVGVFPTFSEAMECIRNDAAIAAAPKVASKVLPSTGPEISEAVSNDDTTPLTTRLRFMAKHERVQRRYGNARIMDEAAEALAASPRSDTGAGLRERAVMVCPQCEGEGGYPDGVDDAACHVECTRCGSNGWIVDLAMIGTAFRIEGDAEARLLREAASFASRIEAAGGLVYEGSNFERWKETARDLAPRLRAALSTDATLSVRSNGEVLEQAAGVADRHAKMGEPIMEPAAYRKASEAIAAEIRALNTNREDAQS